MDSLSGIPVDVLYIMGAARSGSTVLNSVLGTHDDIEGVGELGHLSPHGHVFEEYCACGHLPASCPYWCEVTKVWRENGGPNRIADYIRLQIRFERGRWGPRRLLLQRYRRSEEFETYARQLRSLYQAIQVVSGKRIIVDATKTPWRALVLSMIRGVHLRIIHLVRDVRGVAWSMKKGLKKDNRGGVQRDQRPRPVSRTAVYWLIMNLQASWVRRHVRPVRSMLIRYEDFVAHPELILTQLGSFLERDFGGLSMAAATGAAFSIGHVIAGNRLRMAGEVRLSGDTEWEKLMSAGDRIVCWSLAGCLLGRYGYHFREGRRS